MKLVFENIDETIKHLSPKTSDEILDAFLNGDNIEFDEGNIMPRGHYFDVDSAYCDLNKNIFKQLSFSGADVDNNVKRIKEKLLEIFKSNLDYASQMY
jgi:hypothetical protein